MNVWEKKTVDKIFTWFGWRFEMNADLNNIFEQIFTSVFNELPEQKFEANQISTFYNLILLCRNMDITLVNYVIQLDFAFDFGSKSKSLHCNLMIDLVF